MSRQNQGPRYPAVDMVRDLLAVGGAGLIAAGCYQIYVPAAFIVSGALLFGLAVWKVR